MGIYGFHHIVVRSNNFNDAVSNYRSLGLPLRETLGNTDMGLSIAFFDLPNGGYIEIIVPTRDSSVISPTMKKSGSGMHLIAFNCENLKSYVDQLRKDGIKVMGEPGVGQVLVHPKFTCGILLELREGNAHTGPKPTAAKGIVGFKCVVVRVNDVDKGVRTFSNLGLKCNRRFTNHASGMHHAVFTLKGGGLIEIVAPINSKDLKNPLAKTVINRGEGFNQISLEATSGTVDKLTAAGVKCVREDQSHYWISPKCTMGCLIQLNPVDMGLTSQAKR